MNPSQSLLTAEDAADRNVRILLRTPEAARALGICPRRLFALTKDREIPVVRIGKRGIRYDVADLRAFAEKNKTGDLRS